MTDAARRSVLVTRPEPGLSETMDSLTARGWLPCPSPMLTVTPVPLKNPYPVDRVVVTSTQSLPSLAAILPPTVRMTAVGAKTAERAKAFGFLNVDHADGTASSLIPHIGHTRAHDGILLATGNGLGLDLARTLRVAGWRVIRRVVYRVRPVPRLTAEAEASLAAGEIEAILFYSAVTAKAFLSALGARTDLLSKTRALVLSPQIGHALTSVRFRDVAIARRPDQNALLELLDAAPELDPDAGQELPPPQLQVSQ